MKRIVISVAACLLLLKSSNAQQKASPIIAKSFSLNEVTLSASWIKKRETLNKNFLFKLDKDRLLHNFKVNAGISSTAKPLEGWEHPNIGLRGHFVGHYLSACAAVIKSDNDTILYERVNDMVNELAVCQQKLGGKYLSAFPESDFVTLEKKYTGVWAPYYTYHKIMQGLLDVYLLTGNKKAYTIVLGMADYVEDRMNKLNDETIEKVLFTIAANPNNEAGGMNDVLHQLYAVSQQEKHLKLAKLFDRNWFSDPLAAGKNILSGLHANTHIVLVNGFAKRYENTREEKYKKAVENFWQMLNNHHCYVNGSSSGPRPIATTPTAVKAEHWGKADGLSATFTEGIAESCVTHNSQKLTANLFKWTGNPIYANTYMNTFYNGVLPTQHSDLGTVLYHLPLSAPSYKKFLSENDFRCCNGTAVEAFARLNENIYFHNGNRLWVNLFVPSELNWNEKQLKIIQKNNFPDESTTQLLVKCSSTTSFDCNIFIPQWAGSTTKIFLNGKAFKANIKAGSYVTINRIWQDGDRVELKFDFNFSIQTMKDNQQMISIFYGPTLLAFETNEEVFLKGDTKTIRSALSKKSDSVFLLNNGRKWTLKPLYKINSGGYGVYATIRNEY